MRWFRNGVEVNVNDSSKYQVDSALPEKLTIISLTETLAGEYKCEFQNRVGKAVSVGKVILASKIVILF